MKSLSTIESKKTQPQPIKKTAPDIFNRRVKTLLAADGVLSWEGLSPLKTEQLASETGKVASATQKTPVDSAMPALNEKYESYLKAMQASGGAATPGLAATKKKLIGGGT